MRHTPRPSHVLALVGAIALSASFLQMLPSGTAQAAYPNDPLPAANTSSSAQLWLVTTAGTQGGSRLWTMDFGATPSQFVPTSTAQYTVNGYPTAINGVGYNANDGYLYGVDGTGNLVRIGADGRMQQLEDASGVPPAVVAGTFGGGDTSNVLYVAPYQSSTITAINLDGCGVGTTSGAFYQTEDTSCVTTVSYDIDTPDLSDLFYMDGYLWSVTDTTLYRISQPTSSTPTDGSGVLAVTSYPLTQPDNPNGMNINTNATGQPNGFVDNATFGAQWANSDGTFSLLDNATGNVYTVRPQGDPANPSGFTLVNVTQTSPVGSGQADATSAAGEPIDLGLTKTVAVDGGTPAASATFEPGDTLTYTLTVTNNTPGTVSTQWTVQDDVSKLLAPVAQGGAGLPWSAISYPSTCQVYLDTPTLITCSGTNLTPDAPVTITITVRTSDGTTEFVPNDATLPQPSATAAAQAWPATTAALSNTATVQGQQDEPCAPGQDSSDTCQPNTGTATAEPGLLTLEKAADPTDTLVAGSTVRYTFTLTNQGSASLTNIAVHELGVQNFPSGATTGTDATGTLSSVDCPAAVDGYITLSGDTKTATCTATYEVTPADVAAGKIVNTANATYLINGTGDPITTDNATATTTGTVPAPVPGLTLTKSAQISDRGDRDVYPGVTADNPLGDAAQADAGTVYGAGDVITYTLTVVNSGQTTLSNIAVTDALPGLSAIVCTPSGNATIASLASGQQTTCTATYEVTQADINAGTAIENSAVATSGNVESPTTSDSQTETPIDQTVTIGLDKVANPTAVSAAGQPIVYWFTITNTGNTALTTVTLDDPMLNARVPDGTFVGSGERTLTNVTCLPAGQTPSGEITQNMAGAANGSIALAPGQSVTCAGTYTVTQDDIDGGGPLANTASVTGVTGETSASATDTATVTVAPAAALTLDKVISSGAGAGGGTAGQRVYSATTPGVLTYQFLIANTGGATLTGVGLTDTFGLDTSDDANVLGPITCLVTNPDANGNPQTSTTPVAPSGITLAVGGSARCTATYTLSQATWDGDSNSLIKNTATATSDQTQPVDASASVVWSRATSIVLYKTSDADTVTHAGQVITYTLTAHNTGNVTLTKVNIADNKTGAVSLGDCTVYTSGTYAQVTTSGVTAGTLTLGAARTTAANGSIVMGPGEWAQCQVQYVVQQSDIDNNGDNGSGKLTNVATATGTPPTGMNPPEANKEHDIPIAVQPAILLDKTAEPSRNLGLLDANGMITLGTATDGYLTYTFTATNPATGAGAGNITLTGVKITDITDPDMVIGDCVYLDASGAATTTSASNADGFTLAPGQQVQCLGTSTIAITQATIDAGASVTNEARVTGQGGVTKVSDTDDAVNPVQQGPSIDIAKKATVVLASPDEVPDGVAVDPNTPTVYAAGDRIVYTFTVKNTGTQALDDIYVSDNSVNGSPVPDMDTATCQVVGNTHITYDNGYLPLGAQQTGICTVTYVVTQADIDAGRTITDTATATSGPTTDTTPPVDVVVVQTPGISLVKDTATTQATAADQVINYTYTVTNTGYVTLTGVKVTDPKPGVTLGTCAYLPTNGYTDTSTVDNAAGFALAPSQQARCTGAYTVTQGDLDSATSAPISNTGYVTGTSPTGPVTDDSTKDVPIDQQPNLAITKTPSRTSVDAAGQTIDYNIVVRNTGNVTLHDVTVTDTRFTGTGDTLTIVCPDGPITLGPAGSATDSVTCVASYLTTQGDINQLDQIDNTATANATGPSGQPVGPKDATATVLVVGTPILAVTKSATPTVVTTPGTQIVFTIQVKNISTVTVNDVTVVDTSAASLPGLALTSCTRVDAQGQAVTGGTVTNGEFSLDPGQAVACTATYTVTQTDLSTKASIYNAATATGTTPKGDDPIVVPGDVIVPLIPGTPGISLVKTASTTPVTKAGDVVTYTFTVRNTGTTVLTDVVVNDPMEGLVLNGCTWASLAIGSAPVSCTGTYTVTQADIDGGVIHNAATVTANTPGGGEVPPGGGEVDVTPDPTSSLALVKTAAPTVANAAGQVITYTFTVTNTGTRTVSHVQVLDTSLPGMDFTDSTCSDLGQLAPEQSAICTATYTVTQADINAGGTIDNTATAQGIDSGGDQVVSDPDTAQVTVTRTPGITLDKSASITTGGSEDDQIVYTFLVTNTGNVDLSNVTIEEGAFTGTGPAPQVDASTCTIVSGSLTGSAGALALAPGASMRCLSTPYTVTEQDVLNYFSTVDATTGLGGTLLSNTATANATSPAGPVSDTDDATTALNGPAPSAPAGPTPTTPQPTSPGSTTPGGTTPSGTTPGDTTPATSRPPLVIAGGSPYAPTGGTVVTSQHNLMAIPITAGFFGLLGLLWFGLNRRREERAS